MGLSPMTRVLIRGGKDTKTQRRQPCGGEGRAWTDVSTSQGKPRVAHNPQKRGRRHGLEHGEGMLFCCFKLPNLQAFVTYLANTKILAGKWHSKDLNLDLLHPNLELIPPSQATPLNSTGGRPCLLDTL